MTRTFKTSEISKQRHHDLIKSAKRVIDEEEMRRQASFEADKAAWIEALETWRGRLVMGGEEDEEELYRIAVQLKHRRGFWGKFRLVEHLMGWIYHEAICAYCKTDLIAENLMLVGLATTDHLIPRKSRPDLDTDWRNAVPACSKCNGLKRHTDPSTDEGPTLNVVKEPEQLLQ